jgi:urea transport system permease protein
VPGVRRAHIERFRAHARAGAGDRLRRHDSRIAALNAAVASGDTHLAAFVQALLGDEVKVAGDKVFVVHDGQASDAASGAAATLPDGAEDVTNNNRTRGALEAALAGLRVLSPDLAVRRGAVDELAKASLDESQLPLIEKAFAAETDAGLKGRLERMRATILVSSSDRSKRLAAARELAGSNQSTVASLLQERLAHGGEATQKSAPRCSRRSHRCARGSPGASASPWSSPGSASARCCCSSPSGWRSRTA